MRAFFTNLLAAAIVVAGCQSIELSPYVTDIDNCTSSLSASTKVTPTHLAAYINGYKGIPKTRSAGGHDYIESNNMIYGFTD